MKATDAAGAPPLCHCGEAATLHKRRWWCARAEGGCDYEVWAAPTDAGGGGSGGSSALTTSGGGGGTAASPWPSAQPLCDCARPAVWMCARWFCARVDHGRCNFEWRPPPPRPPPTLLPRAGLELQIARDTAALLTAAALGPLTSCCFVGNSAFGLGLWARTALTAGQALGAYDGPRLPLGMDKRGQCILHIPGTEVIIDGASENSPFELPRCCASYANHSEQPNARLELWPVLRPAACEARQHMVLVASEPIAAGGEIRIDYDSGSKSRSHGTKAFKAKGASSTYWGGAQQGQPGESLAWRQAHCHPPPPAAEGERLVNGLARLQRAAAASGSDPEAACGGLVHLLPGEPVEPLPWEGARGGDARLRVLVPMLSKRLVGLKEGKQTSSWALVATHLPGRTGRECRERWGRLAAGAAGAEQPSRGAADVAASSSSSVAAGAS